jgi:hypothetical protein
LLAACGGGGVLRDPADGSKAANRELSPAERLTLGWERLDKSEYAAAESDFRAALSGPTRAMA